MFIYALYHKPTKGFVFNAGYYNNSHGILCFANKEECQKYIKSYCSGKGYVPKRLKIQEAKSDD